jgi:hypothetical protein
MKTIACVAIFALMLITMATPWAARAGASLPSASGTYRFVLEGELTKQVEFAASWDERGVTTGHLTYTDEASISEQDPDSEAWAEDPGAQFSITADLDSLTIEGNRALISGTVRDSSHRSFVGQWVQLVVEDNGTGQELPDKLTWRLCEPQPGGWVPQDSEDPRDEGAYMQWWATDLEQEDDRGIPSQNIMPGISRSCPTYPLSIYRFPKITGEGDIQVQP